MSFWKQALSSYFLKLYCESSVSLSFWILSFFFVNGPQALYVNQGCLKCISGINLSPVYKNLLTISFILYLVLTWLTNTIKTKEDLLKEFYLKVFLSLNYVIIH